MRKLLFFLLILLMSPFVYSLGSIRTGYMLPLQANLCGDHSQYVTITAGNITNLENVALSSVSARLHLTGNSGLAFITPEQLSLGNIGAADSYSGLLTWTLQCSSPVQGIYTAYINYTSGNGYTGSSIDEAYTLLAIHTSAPLVGNVTIIERDSWSEHAQEEPPVLSDNMPTIVVTTSRNAVCRGSLGMDKPYPEMDFIFYGFEKEHNYTFLAPLEEGLHKLYIRCRDELDPSIESSFFIEFVIDTSPPLITLLSPKAKVMGEFAELSVLVNEPSECRFHKDNINFTKMAAMDSKGNNTFSYTLVELSERSYSYYVKCRDGFGNIAYLQVSFDVEIPPKARILIEKEPPLGKGTYELKLIPSKRLRTVPKLTYTFTDDTSFSREVGLIREDEHFKGYLLIEEMEKTRSGVFSFLGYDLSGNEGTEIEEGAIFLVDTVKPPAPESLIAVAGDDGVSLKWHYEGEKVDQFNVYRSASQGVGHIHFYKSVAGKEFIDKAVSSGQLYYYRVAAVDLAGNTGGFSNEASVYAKSGSGEPEPTVNTNPPTEQTRTWKTQTEKALDTLLIDLEWALNNLRDQAAKESAVDDLSLIKKASEAKEETDKLKNQLNKVELTVAEDTELREALSKADAHIARTRKGIAQSLELVKTTNPVQSTSAADVELAVKEYLASQPSYNYTEKQVKDYMKQMERLNQDVKVETQIKTVSLKYLDSSSEQRIVISKKVGYENPEQISDALLIEIIPKTVAGHISSIDFRTPDYQVINPDPVVAWSFSSFGSEKKSFTYIVFSSDTSESAKGTKTILLIDPKTAIKEKTGIITGFSIILTEMQVRGFELLGILLGIIIVLGLGMYYFVVVNEINIGDYLLRIQSRLPLKRVSAQKEQPLPSLNSKGIVLPERLNEEVKGLSPLIKGENPLRVIPSQYFYARNGDVIRSISEFKEVLSNMDDFTFYYHANEKKNDFADWVEKTYQSSELASFIRKAGSREELLSLIETLK